MEWDYWPNSAKKLDADHATTEGHRELLVRFTTEIRGRGYAYRTVQSFELSMSRFILFCGGGPPEAVVASREIHRSAVPARVR